MIDQGGKAYCAVASAARVLQVYGIEITMDDMAELAGTSEEDVLPRGMSLAFDII